MSEPTVNQYSIVLQRHHNDVILSSEVTHRHMSRLDTEDDERADIRRTCLVSQRN